MGLNLGAVMQAISLADLLVWGSGGLMMVIGYFLKGVMDKQQEMAHEIATLHERYVKKDDFREFKTELWEKLDDLKQQLKDK
jgi:hypothetical protein